MSLALSTSKQHTLSISYESCTVLGGRVGLGSLVFNVAAYDPWRMGRSLWGLVFSVWGLPKLLLPTACYRRITRPRMRLRV
jgi:hypothetical protein